MAAIADDLDTPTAITILDEMSRQLIDAANAGQEIESARQDLRSAASILGLQVTR